MCYKMIYKVSSGPSVPPLRPDTSPLNNQGSVLPGPSQPDKDDGSFWSLYVVKDNDSLLFIVVCQAAPVYHPYAPTQVLSTSQAVPCQDRHNRSKTMMITVKMGQMIPPTTMIIRQAGNKKVRENFIYFDDI